jgi:hypothetical protein
MVLFVGIGFVGGWISKNIIARRTIRSPAEKPEMMWFNKQMSRWERITELQLLVADRVIVTVPVKLIEQSERM